MLFDTKKLLREEITKNQARIKQLETEIARKKCIEKNLLETVVWLSKDKGFTLYDYGYDKNGNPIVIAMLKKQRCREDEWNIDFFIYTGLGRQVGKLSGQLICSCKKAEIIDLICEPYERGKGYGSMLLESFIEVCKAEEVEVIWGCLSIVDKKNFCKSIPFYKKYGFEIPEVSLENKKSSWRIKKYLNKNACETNI